MTNFYSMVKQAKTSWENLQNQKKPVIYTGAASCGRAAGILPIIEELKDISSVK